MSSKQPQIAKACPDLHYIDRKVQRLKSEYRGGYDHYAGAGYTSIEIDDLIEDHRERYLRYIREHPSELAQYLLEREEPFVV